MTISNDDRDIVISHRIARAYEAYEDAVFLLVNKKYTIAVTRIYYGLFYMVNALALQHSFSTGKHQKLIGWFNKEFILAGKIDRKYGKILHRAYDNRMSGDYDDIISFSHDEVESMILDMKDFLIAVELILKV
jgi:uncharacterized protein (UPF0332 family)